MSDIPAPVNLTKEARPWPQALARPIEVTYVRWTGENTAEVARFLGRRYDGVVEASNGLRFLSFLKPQWPGSVVARLGSTFVLASDGRLEVYEDPADFERLYDTDLTARGADIEIIERAHGEVNPRVIAPDDIRINGRPVLAPGGEPVRVHGMEVNGGGLVQVTLTLFARRVRPRAGAGMSCVSLPLKVVLDDLTIAEVPVSCEISTVWEDHAAAGAGPVRRVQGIIHGSTLCDGIADALRKLADAFET